VGKRHRRGNQREGGNDAGEPQWRRAPAKDKLFTGQELTLRRKAKATTGSRHAPGLWLRLTRTATVIYTPSRITEPRADFWDIDFPAPQSAPEALARLLMECSFCQRREVVYFERTEVKSFEVRKCIARVCSHCDSPSIWIEAQQDRTAIAARRNR